MQRFIPLFFLSLALIKGSIALGSNEVAVIEFRPGSTTVDYYVAQQLDRVYRTLPLKSSVELELVPYREIALNYDLSVQLSKQRSINVANYFIRKGVEQSKLSFNTYRKKLFVENISYNQLQEFNAALITRPRLAREKSIPLQFTSSDLTFTNENCLTQSVNSTMENTLYHPNGASVFIPSYAFETESGLEMPTNSVDIKFCVYIDPADFLAADITSNATLRWLESGGMVYIEAYAGKEKLKLRSTANVELNLMNLIGNPDGMMVFTGEQRYNILNWNPSPKDKLKSEATENEKEEVFDDWESEYDESEYAAFEGYLLTVSNLGWINCDRFLEIDNQTELMVNVVGGSDGVAVRIVFESLNSVLPGYAINKGGLVKFDGIPSSERVTVLAFGKQNGTSVWAAEEMVLGSKTELSLSPQAMSENQIKQEIAKFGN
jgi:hypothetical protein